MGKQGELWDDSALINAFNQAISKYQKMHGKVCKENSNGGAGDFKSSTEVTSAVIEASQEDPSHSEMVDDRNNDGSHTTVEIEEAEKCRAAKDNEVSEEHAHGSNGQPIQDQDQAQEEHTLGSNSPLIQDEAQNNSSSLDEDEYNQLYKQYYEVEEQRQKILEKMQYFSSWNYSCPSEVPISNWQWGNYSATQESQSSISQVPCGTMVVSCCSCVCHQCSLASCSSSTCPLVSACGGTICNDTSATVGLRNKHDVENVDIVQTAMGVAERAISTLKDKTSGWNKDNKICNETEQSASSETDLCEMLNAWYSAGFYTGKYLTEQSLTNKRQA